MPRRADSRNLSIQLTPDQYAVLERQANARNIDIAVLVRELIGQGIPEFKALPDLPKRGKYTREKP